ncbi:hypothetical protein BD289DRAFT_425982 [Coniella lustricola]|uniref:Uncharacterized protein n=1 Tax=Coniella lustricola TaxID=2025994 RepID=A0A2T3AGU0_9PEZI|nr:hypothetical protein BD289DRAFT_425982 [Coniella lustricola]
MDFVKNEVEGKMNQDAQPGNSFESAADNGANQEVDKLAGDAGIPQQADGAINEVVDDKVNNEIPGGN